MNIDLFMSMQDEAALIAQGDIKPSVAGVIWDAKTHDITIEFEDGSNWELNIPVEESFCPKLLNTARIFIASLQDNLLAEAVVVPLMCINDPIANQLGEKLVGFKPMRAVSGFEDFMKRSRFAQSVHRDDLSNEDSARSVLMGRVDMNNIKHTPMLARQLQLNVTVRPNVAPNAMPQQGVGPAMGVMGKSSSVVSTQTSKGHQTPPNTNKSDDTDKA